MVEYPQEVARIRQILLSHGISMTDEEAETAWRTYSTERYAAGWLALYQEDEDIWEGISTIPLYSIQDLIEMNIPEIDRKKIR